MYYKNAEKVMKKCETKFLNKEFKQDEISNYIKEMIDTEILVENIKGYEGTECFNYKALNNGREEFIFCICVKSNNHVSSFIPF